MCLAVPMQVVSLEPGQEAIVELDGVRQRVSLALLEGIEPGDHVIVHVGFALARLDETEARSTLNLLESATPSVGNTDSSDSGSNAGSAEGTYS